MQAAQDDVSEAVTRSTMVLARSDVASESLTAATSMLALLISAKANAISAREPAENAALEVVARRYI